MAYNLKDKTCCVIDTGGSFIYVAQKLSQYFGKVYYYYPWERGFVEANNYIVGRGIPEIINVDNVWDVYEEIDLFYFTDLYYGAWQEFLRKQGKLVYGAGRGEEMELYRDKMKQIQKDVGLYVNEYHVITGLKNLREYLEDKSDLYIKMNFFRGDHETWHFDDMRLSKKVLDELQHKLGAYQENEVFVVESPIPDAIEIGYDGWAIAGRYTSKVMWGCELKDCAYIGKIVPYAMLPTQLQTVNKKLSHVFEEYNYLGDYSNEVRLQKGGNYYLIDQTTRCPSPPTALKIEMFEDYGSIVWSIANGIVPNVIPKYEYGVELVIISEWAEKEPQPIYFDMQYKNFVKIKQLYIDNDGVWNFIPQGIEIKQIGSIVGVGRSFKEAIAMCKKIGETVKGYGIEINLSALDSLNEKIKEVAEYHITNFR